MGVAANALTALATVKTELGISASTDDAYLERLINAASDFIERYCSRQFQRASVTEKVQGYGDSFLRLGRRPIDTAVAITITLDGAAVDSISYEVHDAEAGLLIGKSGWADTTSLFEGPAWDGHAGSERKLYSVTYTGGYVLPGDGGTRTLPYDLEDACVGLVVSRYRSRGQDQRIKSESLLSYSVTFGEAEIPAPILAVLDRHKTLVQA